VHTAPTSGTTDHPQVNAKSRTLLNFLKKPKKGFEPLTPALRKRCSTVELLRRPTDRPPEDIRQGFDFKRTAGTGSGAIPVPLFSRTAFGPFVTPPQPIA
jgi:hypothetical protein